MRRLALCVLAAMFLFVLPAAAEEVSPEAATSFIKAKNLVAQGKLDEAIKELDTTISLNPKLYLAYFLRGMLYEGKKRYDEAIADYSKTIELHAFVGPYIQRARCYMYKGQAAPALADFAKAEAMSPNNGDIYLNRAVLYFSLKQYDKAQQDIDKARKAGKKVPEEFAQKVKEAAGGGGTSPGGTSGATEKEEGGVEKESKPQPPPPTTPGATTTPTAEGLPQLIKRVLPGVVKIYAYDISGNLADTGSGFFINKQGWLITNHHVLENKTHAKAKVGKKLYPIKGVMAVSRKEKWDLALAQVDAPPGSYSVLPLAQTIPEVGERIVVVGAPLGFEQSVSEGIVAAVRVVSQADLPKIPVLQVTAPISPGSSGGPVLNLKGEVVGVISFLFPHGQNVNFAIPVEYVRKLEAASPQPLAKVMLDQETIQAQAFYEYGKKQYNAGNYEEALAAFKKAVQLYDKYARAYNYLGLTYRKLKKYREAEKAYVTAVKLNPRSAVYVYNLGFLYYLAESYKDARQVFEVALKLAPKDADVNLMLGKTCVHLKDRVEAARRYEALKQLDAAKAQELYRLINR